MNTVLSDAQGRLSRADEGGADRGPGGSRAERVRAVVVSGFAVPWALLSAWWLPRGPATTTQSLACIAVGLLLGGVMGWLARSRWPMLIAPVVYAAVFELARIGTDGPTVDGMSLSAYGVIALVTGRLFHGVVAIAPLVWGVAAGAAWERTHARVEAPRRPGTIAGRWAGRMLLGVCGVTLLVLTGALARPATTAPIADPAGDEVAGSIAELTSVNVGGHELGLMIRGHDRANPVLLFLAGGPGGSELGAMRRHLPDLERHFTVVTWDQRGAGRSYAELDPVDTLTLSGALDDTLTVTDHLRGRFGQDRIYLVGQSWGSTLGILAIQAAPERYAAFVGVGQMVSQRATDRIYYDETLKWAARNGQADLVAKLTRIGPPPYRDARLYESVLSHEMAMYPYDHSPNSEGQGQMAENLIVEEYTLTEQVRLLAGFLDTFAALYPQLQDIDFRRSATSFTVPVFFVQGAHETPGRARPFDDWYPRVSAPVKDRVVFDSSGHRPLFEQPREFVDYLTEVVLPRTTAARGQAR